MQQESVAVVILCTASCSSHFCCVDLTAGNTENSLKKAREVLKTVQGWSDKALPNKAEVLGNLYSYIGTISPDFRFSYSHTLISLPTKVWQKPAALFLCSVIR